jgi:hypothetical protein
MMYYYDSTYHIHSFIHHEVVNAKYIHTMYYLLLDELVLCRPPSCSKKKYTVSKNPGKRKSLTVYYYYTAALHDTLSAYYDTLHYIPIYIIHAYKSIS